MNPIQKYLAPMLSRLIALALVGVGPWLLATFGIELDEETRRTIVDFVVAMILYVIGHRLLSMKLNPTDVAKPVAAAAPETNPLKVPQQPPTPDSAPGT